MRTLGFSILALSGLLGAAHGVGAACDMVPIVRYQPVELVCSGLTTASTITSLYMVCKPTTCVVTVPSSPVPGADITTETVYGPVAGTTTEQPAESGGETTVIVTEATGSGTLPTKLTMDTTGRDPLPTDTTESAGESTTEPMSTTTNSLDQITRDPTTTEPTTESTTEPPASTTDPTTSPTPTSRPNSCPDVENGSFDDPPGTLAPWYLSNQVTADSSSIVAQGPEGISNAFALIPSQDSAAQVYLNQPLPSCGSPPPLVTLMIRFQYQFTGDSTGCTIRATVNRDPTLLVDISDAGAVDGMWMVYQGGPIEVQLTYDPLFTIELACSGDTANDPAILITDITVY